MNRTITRGDIFYIDRFGYQVGSEQRSGRPGIVVSCENNNLHSETVEVVYLTTQPKSDLPTHVTIWSTGLESTALCEQITTVSEERLGSYIGYCTDSEMLQIDAALLISLGISTECGSKLQEAGKECVHETEPVKYRSDDVHKIEIERDLYKQLYMNLLDRLLQIDSIKKNID